MPIQLDNRPRYLHRPPGRAGPRATWRHNGSSKEMMVQSPVLSISRSEGKYSPQALQDHLAHKCSKANSTDFLNLFGFKQKVQEQTQTDKIVATFL